MTLIAAVVLNSGLVAQQLPSMTPAEYPASIPRAAGSRKPLARGSARVAPRYRLAAPDAQELKLLSKPQSSMAVGVHRNISFPEAARTGEWLPLANGGTVYRVAVQSPGAVSLRIHFERFSAGDGEVWIYPAESESTPADGPYQQKGPHGDGDFWSAILPGDAAVIEYRPAAGSAQERIPFEIDKISHLVKNVLPEPAPSALELQIWNDPKTQKPALSLLPENAATCHEDVTCYADWAQSAGSVARIAYERDGGSFVCSGSLLNTRSSSFIPYYLTNAHCIDGPATARTITALFNFQTGTCRGPVNRGTQMNGATYLAGGSPEDLDFALIRLAGAPQGSWYSGWSLTPLALGATVTIIGHPQGDYKRIAFGTILDIRGNNYTYRFTQGLTEGGNSGGPLFGAPNMIVGIHARGNSQSFEPNLCAALTDSRILGGGELFRPIYDQISNYLEDGGACHLVLTPSLVSVGGGGGSASINLAAASGCAWTGSSNAPWVTISSKGPGSGPGTVGLTIAANSSPTPRTARVTFGTTGVTINQAGAVPVCQTQPHPGGALNGTLSATVCGSTRRPGRAAAFYQFTGTANSAVTIEMNSSAVDSYLYLVGPNGQVIASDDDGGGRPNSRIPAGTGTLTLPASGTYTIEATTFSASEQGAFTLTLTTGGAGTALSLAPDTVRLTAVRGGASAPVSVEVRGAASEPRVSPQQSWLRAAASGSAGGVYRYAVSADASALTPGNYSGRVLFAVEDRTLTLTASLIVSAPSGSECETQPITLGSSVSGSLTASSCRSARQANSYASRYSFAARAGEGVRIQLGAPNMDPYLYLFDAAGTLIAADDDSGGGNDARIPSTGNFLTLAAAGTYFIEATTFGSNETGTFSLRLESAASAARGRPAFQLAGVTNAASFGTNYGRPGTTVGGIAPGQMVTIFGSDLGPDSIAYGSFQGDRLATSVSGTRVLIGGVPAPVIYAARNQVAAIVPYAVAQLSRTSIVVEASAQASEPISVPVIRAAPGIFASGGNCACTNPRGAVSAGNPTSRGEVVTIFATGEGQTSPFGVDGLAVTREPLPRPLLPVSVLIGGVNAPVLYAGHAPGLPGLLQVNAVVPAAASPGAVPIQIVITDPVSGLLYFSQSGLNTLVR